MKRNDRRSRAPVQLASRQMAPRAPPRPVA